MKRMLAACVFAISMVATVRADAPQPLKVLDCRATGPSKAGERVIEFTIIPPKPGGNLSLWTLTEDDQPDKLIKSGVAKGEIEVDYGSHSERHDLVFLSVGNRNGASHVAFWFRSGVLQHENFVVVDIWDPEIPVQVMESAEPQPYVTGHCKR